MSYFPLLKWLFSRTTPPVPFERSTKSYWLSEADETLANYVSDTHLPSYVVDYCVIGSGISGTSTALELLKHEPGATVVLLEARQFCSGATGRNGGLLTPHTFVQLYHSRELLDPGQAMEDYTFQHKTLRAIADYVAQHKCADEVGFRETTLKDVYFDCDLQSRWEDSKVAYEVLSKEGFDLTGYKMYEGEEARKHAQTENAVGVIESKSAVIWAYKFVCHMARNALSRGLLLFNNTLVHSVRMEKQGHDQISVLETSRGGMRARKVIHATNGFVSYLVPQLKAAVIPMLEQVCALKPSGVFARDVQGALWLRHRNPPAGLMEYAHQRVSQNQDAPNPIIIGSGIHRTKDLAAIIGGSDDALLYPNMASNLRRVLPTLYGDAWTDDEKGQEEAEALFEWTGTEGTSLDDQPIVGKLHDGNYTITAFSGTGMTRCFLAAHVLAAMVQNRPYKHICDPSLVFTDPQEAGLFNTLGKLWKGFNIY